MALFAFGYQYEGEFLPHQLKLYIPILSLGLVEKTFLIAKTRKLKLSSITFSVI